MTTDTITSLIQAAEQAREALENYRQAVCILSDGPDDSDVSLAGSYLSKASRGATVRITELTAAIEAAKQEREAEPYCYAYEWDTPMQGVHQQLHYSLWNGMKPNRTVPLYTTPQPQVPEGWQLVPVEPTKEMLIAAHTRAAYFNENADEDANIDDMVRDEYKAMLAAAPKKEGE